MAILDRTGKAALQRSAILNLLCEAWENDEVVSEKDLLAVAGNYSRERLKEVARHYTLGFEERDGERYYSLAVPIPGLSVQRAGSMRGGERQGPSLATGSLDSQPIALFELEPEPHWKDAA